jgi:hypothetical protein
MLLIVLVIVPPPVAGVGDPGSEPLLNWLDTHISLC